MAFRRAEPQHPDVDGEFDEDGAFGQASDDSFDDTDDPDVWPDEFEPRSGWRGRMAGVVVAVLVVASAGWFGLQLLHGSSNGSGARIAVPATEVATTAPTLAAAPTSVAVISASVTSSMPSVAGSAAPTVADSTTVETANHDQRIDGGPLVAVGPASSAESSPPPPATTSSSPAPRRTPAVPVSATRTSAPARAVTVPPPTVPPAPSSAPQEPSAPPTPAPTEPGTNAPPTAAPPTAAPPTAAPPTAAPPTAAPPTVEPTNPATTAAPTSPPTTKPPTFVHVIAAGEGPVQVAAWFDQIGKSSLYRQTKALHRPLPTGTVITVVGNTVRIS